MKVIYSEKLKLNDVGPQEGILGILEFLAQSNDYDEIVEEEDKDKFVDDLTVLEIINLLCKQISSYDFKVHVPSDIPCHNS